MLQAEVTMPLSHTVIKAFETCPQRFYRERVLKQFHYVQSESALRGEQIHRAFENYIKDNIPLDASLSPYSGWVETFAKQPGEKYTELAMAIDWQDKKVGFLRGKNIWLRGKVDLLIDQGEVGYVIDYKTGKSKYADMSQVELMAMLSFIYFPHLQTITGALVFIDENKIIRDTYTRDKMAEYRERWMSRSIPIVQALTSRKFPMKQSGLCAFCPVLDCPFYAGE